MINLFKAQKEFNDYLKSFDLSDEMIKLKIRHTYGVMALSEYISKDLNLSQEDIELAQLIALLHDIARFIQVSTFGDFRDYKTLDHADLAVEILFGEQLIRRFIEDDKYDSIMLKAIKNHNKLSIEEGLTEKELLHSRIIRDADKADNFRVNVNEDFAAICNSSKEQIEDDYVSEKVYNTFMNGELIITRDRATVLDNLIGTLAFIFDFNFPAGLKYIKENDYVNAMIDRFSYKKQYTVDQMEEIRKRAVNYINKQIGDTQFVLN